MTDMGMVLNLQRFSVHDGPGIRTTVFLKGCPLRCRWCHNPESLSVKPDLGYLEARCTLCGLCLQTCPSGALTMEEDRIVCDREKCRACFECVRHCPSGARKVYGKEMSPREVADVVLRDVAYYEKSGGGVTFSGGEPLMQADFVLETAAILKEKGIHTAIETSLCGDWKNLKALTKAIDYFIMDIKVMDEAKHRQFTGVSNRNILENFRRLSSYRAEGLVRIPLVVGCNDTAENMEQTADFLIEHTCFREVELLKMHKLAEHKYASLDLPYGAENIPVPDDAKVAEMEAVLREKGIRVKED